MKRFFRSAAFPILVVFILAFFAQRLISPAETETPPTYTEFLEQVQREPTSFEQIKFNTTDNMLEVTEVPESSEEGAEGRTYETGYLPNTEQQTDRSARQEQRQDRGRGPPGRRDCLGALTYILPFILFLGFWIFLMNQMQGGGSRVMSFGKSKAKRMSVDAPKITFRDVAGADEAVQELHEIKEFLENPKKFQALGARIPKGVLLYGPPGTGKTLLARAVAGEAGVPFFSISGSDFVEMFVGVGASRVRDLFEQAKQNSPCIIFMDEIDAVGRHRGAGMGGGHDEREQTLNQLLVEMDGFEIKDNIILIAATNRPDILDPALLRPGRFDRQIAVDRPDRHGRARSSRSTPVASRSPRRSTSTSLAGQTPGFTGADLANLINEAALLTARTGKREITMDELEEGIMRVIAGPEKKTRVMSEKERLITAYHEMGHAIVGHLLPNCDPVHKISIISRGQALGYTISPADRGQVPDHPRRARRHDGDDPGRPRRRGDRLRRDHHRRLERPREGHRDRQADGHALRHVREARPARLRPRPRASPSSAARWAPSPTTPMRSPATSTTRSAAIVEEAHQSAKDILAEQPRAPGADLQDPARARDDRGR